MTNQMLEFAALQVEQIKLDCVCATYWAPYNKLDPQCEAHDLATKVRSIAAELRAQIQYQ